MRKARLWGVLASLLLLTTLASVGWAQAPIIDIDDLDETQLASPDPADHDFFGSPVAIHGDWLVVGAVGDDEKAPNAGAAYVFRRSNGRWMFHQKLMANDGDDDDDFGIDVDIFEEWIVVAAPNHDESSPNAAAPESFLQEPPAATSLGHTDVCSIHEIGEAETPLSASGRPLVELPPTALHLGEPGARTNCPPDGL